MTSILTESGSGIGSQAALVVIRMPLSAGLSDEMLMEISASNRDLQFERNPQGELVVMSPAGGDTGNRNAEIIMQLQLWAKQDGTGKCFDSSTGFRLSNSAVRSPDAAWVSNSRLDALTADERRKFLPLCPDFVIELFSPSDGAANLAAKMQEYIACGAQLGLLIDPDRKRVTVYRSDEEALTIDNANEIACEPVLPGFKLDLAAIW